MERTTETVKFPLHNLAEMVCFEKKVMFNRVIFIDTFTLARLSSEETGLDCDIWLDSLGRDRKNGEQPYILIRRSIGWKKIYTHKTSKAHQQKLRLWCENNKDVIERHWNKELSDAEALNTLANNKM